MNENRIILTCLVYYEDRNYMNLTKKEQEDFNYLINKYETLCIKQGD